MGESAACLVHSFSYSASISHESHEALDFPGNQTENSQGFSERESRLVAGNSAEMLDNPLHALNQSISFGRFMTESLEWGKWSSFSHKKYVEEAEKFSRPGSVAQKKAFFEAHYKKKAGATKAGDEDAESPEENAADAAVSLNASESVPVKTQEVKEHATEIGSVTGADGSRLSVEKNEPGRTSVAVSEKDPAVENSSHKPIVVDDNKASDDVTMPAVENPRKRNSSVGNRDEVEESARKDVVVGDKVEGRKSATKNSPGWRVSVEISVPPRTSNAAKKTSFSENRSEIVADNALKEDEIPVRRRFSFLNCLMTKSKTQGQNATRKKGRKQEKKLKKRSLCLCFKPRAVRESETPRNYTEKDEGESQSRNL